MMVTTIFHTTLVGLSIIDFSGAGISSQKRKKIYIYLVKTPIAHFRIVQGWIKGFVQFKNLNI